MPILRLPSDRKVFKHEPGSVQAEDLGKFVEIEITALFSYLEGNVSIVEIGRKLNNEVSNLLHKRDRCLFVKTIRSVYVYQNALDHPRDKSLVDLRDLVNLQSVFIWRQIVDELLFSPFIPLLFEDMVSFCFAQK